MTITGINELAAVAAAWLWRASWQGGLALLLVLLVSRGIRRIPANVRCWLWRLAYLKLLVVGILLFPVELRWLPPISAASVKSPPATVTGPELPSREFVRDDVSTRSIPVTIPSVPSVVPESSSPEAMPQLSLWSWTMIFWISGVVTCFLNLQRQWRLARGIIATLEVVKDAGLHLCLVESCRRMHLRRIPELRVCTGPGSPCVIGLFRPLIVFPTVVLESCSTQALQAALLHELAHVKRRDLFWNWLPALAEVLFYFHPLVWLARREWRLAQEIATDELAVSASRMDVARYAGWLVELVAKCRTTRALPHLAIGVGETFSQLSRRMCAMQTFQPLTPRRRIAAHVAVFVIAVAALVPWKLTARTAQADPGARSNTEIAGTPALDQPSETQSAALLKIQNLGGEVVFDETSPEKPVISISLFQRKVADNDLIHLTALTGLRALTLDGTQVTSAGLVHLKELTRLQALDLNSTRVNDEGLAHLKALTKLEHLGLIGTEVTDAGLAHLTGLTSMQMLFLGDTKVGDHGLLHLKGLQKLQLLGMNGTKVSDAGLEQLAGLTGLQDLRLNETNLTDAGLRHLGGLNRLQTLVLNSTNVGGEGLVHLGRLPRLQALWLDSAKITDAGLKHAKGLTSLKTLVLRNTKVTDLGLEQIAGLTTLKTLDLGNTAITDAGLEHLKKLVNLRTLNLDGDAHVTDAGVEKLQSALPACNIPRSSSKNQKAAMQYENSPAAKTGAAKTADELLEEFSAAEYFWQQGEVARKLIALGDKTILPRLEKLLDLADRHRRCNAALVLAGLGEKRGLDVIISELEDQQPRPTTKKRSDGKPDPQGQIREDRYYAALLLGQLGRKEAVPALIKATADSSIREQAAISLGQIGDRSAIPALRRMVVDFPEVRLWAGYGLAALDEPEGFDILTSVALADARWTERRHAVEALGKLGNSETVRTLTKALRDEYVNVRVSAAVALGRTGDSSALPTLTEALNDTEKTQIGAPTSVAGEARKAIDAIQERVLKTNK